MHKMAGAVFGALALFGCAAADARPRAPAMTLPDEPARSASGALTLHPCASLPARCGRLARPLDPSGRVPGDIGIAFLLYPHLNASLAAVGTIVATEGGPGFATSSSRAGYLTLFAPLRGDHDLLLVDNRGTGRSQAIECTPLQTMKTPTIAAVGACGAALGDASDLYGSGLAADDLAAVLDALSIDRIDLYGDSYGTFFAQVFAALHKLRLRSVVLDGAYPVIGEDPFYLAAGVAVRRDFDLVCQRALACRTLPGRSLDRIERLLHALRATAVSGTAPDGNGAKLAVVADAASVGTILYDGTSDAVNYRELDPAARALLDAHDAAPLLRLVAENIRSEGTGLPGGAPSVYSRGLFAAVSCMDYTQLYDMAAPVAQRQAQSAAMIAGLQASDPAAYSPLTIAEWLTVPLDLAVLNLCLEWPVNLPPYPPGQPATQDATFTDAPTLVISGELDALTTPIEASVVTGQFPHARHLVVANSFHVDAIDDIDGCAAAIVRRFVATLNPGDTGCIARINEVRMPPAFVRHAGDVPPALASAGNAATPADLALAAAVVQTAGDVVARWWVNTSGADIGLRGGGFTIEQPGHVVGYALRGVRWTEDMAVSGRITWDQSTGAIRGRLEFTGPGAISGSVDMRWNDRTPLATALLTGVVDGRALMATMPAP